LRERGTLLSENRRKSTVNPNRPPLLPLVLADVPRGLRLALAQEGIPYRFYRPGLAQGRFLLFDSRKGPCPATASGQTAIDVDQLRPVGDEDPFAALLDERSASFEWRVAGLLLCEEIARVDKRAVRRQVLGQLRTLIEQAGGIWLCVSPYPFPYRSAFNFRFDHDGYDPQDFERLLEAIAGQEQATSHFVNAAAYQGAEEVLGRLRGLDVGSHGFWHHTYRTKEENLRNIRRGIDTLAAAGLAPQGFAAPHGRFNRGLLAALEDLGVPYSSEFGLAYDELPFFVAGSDVLQVPIHPVCLGLFLDALKRERCEWGQRAPDLVESAVDETAQYFEQVAGHRYRTGEPVFLYGHPDGRLGRHPRVLRHVFETISGFGGIWRTTLTEFAQWWRVRAKVHIKVWQQGEHYVIRTHLKPAGYRVGIEYWRGGHAALLPLDRPQFELSPAALAYEKRTAVRGVQPVRIDRPDGLRGRIRRLLDWERVTPVSEIGARSWRNWAKRTLRQLWGE
jgi:hypothetical protein